MTFEQTGPAKTETNAELKEDLLASGVTKEGADYYAQALSGRVVHDFAIRPRNKDIFPNAETADRAFRRLLPEMGGHHFKRLHIENLGSMITDKSLSQGKAPAFTADAISFRWCDIDTWDNPEFMNMIAASGARDVSLKQTNIENEHVDLGQFLLDHKIERFTYGGTDISFARIGEKLKETGLKKLDVSFCEARFGGLIRVLENLPHTLEELNVSGIVINSTEKSEALLASLDRLKNLKKFEASGCSLGDYSFEQMMPHLAPGIEELNLGSNPYVTDKGAQVLLDHMEQPDSRIRRLGFEIMTKVSPEMRQKLQQAAEDGENRFMQNIQQEKAAQIAKTKEGMRVRKALEEAVRPDEIKALLNDALECGIVERAFEKMKQAGTGLTPEDVNRKGKDGRTFMHACADMGKIPQMMAPDMFRNVRDFQAVFDALPQKEKRIYDGCRGRPTLQKIKNGIMAASVRAALAQKTKNR